MRNYDMHIGDIIRLSISNLYRRKGRTILTVSGVVIGCCAVVIMISMGIGMKESQEQALQSMGNLLQITVSPVSENAVRHTALDKEAVKKIEAVSQVSSIVPKKRLDLGVLKVTTGDNQRYQGDAISIVSISDEYLKNAGYQITEGKNLGNREGEVLVGEHLAYQFTDSKRPDGKNMVDYWSDESARPYFEILKSTLSVCQKNEQNIQDSENTNNNGNVTWSILENLVPVGIMKQNYDTGDETDTGIVMCMKDFERLASMVQKVTHSSVSKEYSQVIVNVKDISSVEAVENQIKAMGFQTSSMESIRKPMEESARQKQLMLAGLGAVSLFVAAIGIANTMIMSITERTREIGILKALGCSLSDIRKEFLIEAALIGFIGGVAGAAVSCGVSGIMNSFSGISLTDSTLMYAEDTVASTSNLSVIPLWLIVFAVLFSVIMGITAGFLPANRAVHISALEAMKS